MTSSTHHEQYMQLALEQARLALDDDEVPVGCIFVDHTTDTVLAAAYNRTNATKNATQHCEMVAINDMLCTQQLSTSVFAHFTLYVTVEPCIMCAAALQYCGLHTVVFGCSNTRFGGCVNTCIDTKVTYNIVQGIYAQQAIELLQQFYERGNPNAPEYKRNRPLVERPARAVE